jgi:hypothetical protein
MTHQWPLKSMGVDITMSYHLRQVCDIHTRRVVWTNGKHYMSAVDYAKHARKDALISEIDKLLAQ